MSEELFAVRENAEIGRYAVASRALKAGEVIFSELPFAFGPKSDSPPVCLGCLSPADCRSFCSTCTWPVCNPSCAALPIHRNNECRVLAASRARFFPLEDPSSASLQYECITPLRVLLAKEKHPQRWLSEVARMETHEESRKKLPLWRFNQVNIVDYLRGPVKLHRFSSELIHRVCGVLEVNAFEARTPSGHLIRCLYPKLAILSHNCVSNITHSIAASWDSSENAGFRVTVRAAVDVREEAELFSSYTYSLWPTLVRREFLKQSKFFECKCERCSDPAELGSHLGSLRCPQCGQGAVVSSRPLTPSSSWNCTSCSWETAAEDVRKVYAESQKQFDDAVQAGADLGGLCERLGERLHPKNAYLTELRTVLIGRAGGCCDQKVELCREVLEVLDVVEPGLTRIRGITLYELHVSLVALARNRYESGVIEREEFCGKMKEAVGVLGESVEILVFEPETSREGRLGRVAKAAHEKLVADFDF